MVKSKEIRQQFIQFFKERGHKEVKSSPVIPIDDPTLLFTNAGMNQFKDIFLDKRKAEQFRVVNSQKCIRAGGKHNDLEEVGLDGYHHTFFEMLGNWSFGDYYKKEAISWAWELLTEIWKLSKEKLFVTVHHSDEEAFNLWKNNTDIDSLHIEYHGDKDNFWEMGETGPCGPCSEIHFDRGKEFCNLKDDSTHKCKVNGNCHRYIELWNLVFIQYFRDKNGVLSPLSHKFVDTGAGFERIVQVLQNKNSNYETDLFSPIIKKIEKFSRIEYFSDSRGISHRVIADHIRALSFALADGGMPSNEGRGYVLRRILRRAARHGHLLCFNKPFLYLLVDTVMQLMSDCYPELKEKSEHIKIIIKAEEERFNLTLDNGISKFEEIVQKIDKTFPGKAAFMLYDTFGFPLDLTIVMAKERGLQVDEKEFQIEMQKQKERSRNTAKFEMNIDEINWIELKTESKTDFVGYSSFSTECFIQKYVIDDDNNVKIILNKTPFYAESGGQVADIGKIYNDEGEIRITNVYKNNDQFIHVGKLIEGTVNSKKYSAEIKREYRKNIARNHTVTHILHKALKTVLGDHVQQKGSMVHADYLRFDFTHFKQVSARELRMVEQIVNQKIRECIPVNTEIQSVEEARKSGAIALFGEKYGETVRVVTIGDFSKELCGGTHVSYSGAIGLFKITTESSIAAGIRRIEAVSGEKAEKIIYQIEDDFNEVARLLNVPENTVIDKLSKLIEEQKELQKELTKWKDINTGIYLDKLIENAWKFKDIAVVIAKIEVENPAEMRKIGDQFKDKIKSGIGVFISEINNKVSILVVVTKDLTPRFQAGKIVAQIAEVVGGKGGGRPDLAMAGGKETAKISEALRKTKEIIEIMASKT